MALVLNKVCLCINFQFKFSTFIHLDQCPGQKSKARICNIANFNPTGVNCPGQKSKAKTY